MRSPAPGDLVNNVFLVYYLISYAKFGLIKPLHCFYILLYMLVLITEAHCLCSKSNDKRRVGCCFRSGITGCVNKQQQQRRAIMPGAPRMHLWRGCAPATYNMRGVLQLSRQPAVAKKRAVCWILCRFGQWILGSGMPAGEFDDAQSGIWVRYQLGNCLEQPRPAGRAETRTGVNTLVLVSIRYPLFSCWIDWNRLLFHEFRVSWIECLAAISFITYPSKEGTELP
jgi:hypothetical protein